MAARLTAMKRLSDKFNYSKMADTNVERVGRSLQMRIRRRLHVPAVEWIARDIQEARWPGDPAPLGWS